MWSVLQINNNDRENNENCYDGVNNMTISKSRDGVTAGYTRVVLLLPFSFLTERSYSQPAAYCSFTCCTTFSKSRDGILMHARLLPVCHIVAPLLLPHRAKLQTVHHVAAYCGFTASHVMA